MWSVFTAEDDPLWSKEVVEIFIDPDGKDWDIARLKTAVQTHGTVNDSLQLDQGWAVEIAIPWAAMTDSVTGGAHPTPGDIWRLNLYRIERKAGRALKGHLDALEAEAAPLQDEIEALWQGATICDTEQLDDERRRQLSALDKRLKLIMERLKPLQHHYREQTEFTGWSETYTRGFHHPTRFGAVQFMD